jgi:hypothetical protein|tara:strand:- start:167 stop:382 length:216 start_codon:yes stop_codon:yes gene_type:complete
MVALVERFSAYSARRDRRSQTKALSVDRSMFATTPLVRWSPEAEAAEEWLRPIRREATISDKLAAWRAFSA